MGNVRSALPTICALNGVPWGSEIICGHNPCLLARLVDDLTIEAAADGKELGTWIERPMPDVTWMRNKGCAR